MERSQHNRVGLVAVLLGCGPQTASQGGDGTGTATDAPTDASTDGASTSTTAPSDESSTGIEPWDPASGCDPRFDLGLASGTLAWAQPFAVGADDSPGATAVAVDARGLVYAAGFFRYPDRNADAHGWLHAVSADGEPRWDIRYEPDTLRQEFTDVAVAPSGDMIVVGYELVSAPASEWGEREVIAVVLRYSPAGATLWRREIEGISEGYVKVAVGTDGRIVVAGRSQAAIEDPFPGDIFVADIAETGELLDRWIPTSDSHLLPLGPADLSLDADGTLYLLATGYPEVGPRAPWVGRWDAEGSYLGAFVHEEGGQAIALNPREGGALVLWRDESYRPSLRRFDRDGVELWARAVGFEHGLDARALATDCDGNALVAADYWDGEVGQNWLFRIDDRGQELDRIDLGTPYGWTFEGVEADPFGNAVLAGRAWLVDDDHSFVVRKYAR